MSMPFTDWVYTLSLLLFSLSFSLSFSFSSFFLSVSASFPPQIEFDATVCNPWMTTCVLQNIEHTHRSIYACDVNYFSLDCIATTRYHCDVDCEQEKTCIFQSANSIRMTAKKCTKSKTHSKSLYYWLSISINNIFYPLHAIQSEFTNWFFLRFARCELGMLLSYSMCDVTESTIYWVYWNNICNDKSLRFNVYMYLR